MLKRIMLTVVFMASIVSIFSAQAFARQSVTCSGKRLYLEQTLPSGEEACWDSGLTCSGEWTYSWLVAKKKADTATMTSAARQSANSEESEATRLLQSANKASFKLFYQAPASVVQAFKERARWPKEKGPIILPPGSPGPTFPDPPPMEIKQKGYPPNGYPCLGCKPCPPPADAYCDIVWGKAGSSAQLTERDLDPRYKQQGYAVVAGKIVKKEPPPKIR